MEGALRVCQAAIEERRSLQIGVVNAAKIVNMRRNRLLHEAIASAQLVVADGMPVIWASRLLGQPLPERVTGIELFERLLALADERGHAVYLLGSAQDVLEEVVRRIRARHPRVRVAGSRNGYFTATQEANVAAEIRASGADMLFVAISPPRKELFLARWGQHLSVPVCHGVGGAFDVLAGKVKRAPRWMQRSGLEWLYRLCQEPRRMWRRYLVTNSQFLLLFLLEVVRTRCLARTRTLSSDHS